MGVTSLSLAIFAATISQPAAADPKPSLRFVERELGGHAWSEQSCDFSVEFVDDHVVSTDGRFIVHRRDRYVVRGDDSEDWSGAEPFYELPIFVVDVDKGSSYRLPSLLRKGTKVPRRRDGTIHCGRLRPLLEAGVARVNKAIPSTHWRALQPWTEFGSVTDGENPLESVESDELVAQLDYSDLVIRRGSEELHRISVDIPGSDCAVGQELEPQLRDPLVDLESGSMLMTTYAACFCIGEEGSTAVSVVLPPDVRAAIHSALGAPSPPQTP